MPYPVCFPSDLDLLLVATQDCVCTILVYCVLKYSLFPVREEIYCLYQFLPLSRLRWAATITLEGISMSLFWKSRIEIWEGNLSAIW